MQSMQRKDIIACSCLLHLKFAIDGSQIENARIIRLFIPLGVLESILLPYKIDVEENKP